MTDSAAHRPAWKNKYPFSSFFVQASVPSWLATAPSPWALLNLIFHTSYLSRAVKNSHEYVIFWHVWQTRTTNFEILIGPNSSQMSHFRRVKNSHVFVTYVDSCPFARILHTCDKYVYHKRVFVMRSYLSEVCRFLWNLECRYLTYPTHCIC